MSVEFKERFTFSNIGVKASNIVKLSVRELRDSKLSGLHSIEKMLDASSEVTNFQRDVFLKENS